MSGLIINGLEGRKSFDLAKAGPACIEAFFHSLDRLNPPHESSRTLCSWPSGRARLCTGPCPYQGYGEGEYVLVAPQIPGTLETLDVERGQMVKKGTQLVHAGTCINEQAAVDQAKAESLRAESNLADMIKAQPRAGDRAA